jgi:hypothetical protein
VAPLLPVQGFTMSGEWALRWWGRTRSPGYGRAEERSLVGSVGDRPAPGDDAQTGDVAVSRSWMGVAGDRGPSEVPGARRRRLEDERAGRQQLHRIGDDTASRPATNSPAEALQVQHGSPPILSNPEARLPRTSQVA